MSPASPSRRQNSLNESRRSCSSSDSSTLVERRRFASATASMARSDAPTRYSARASPVALVLEALDQPLAVDAGQGAQAEAQLVQAKAPLLALELRLDLARLATVRRPSSRASLALRAISSSWSAASGATASSSAAAISRASAADAAGVPVSRAGTLRHRSTRAARSASRDEHPRAAQVAVRRLARRCRATSIGRPLFDQDRLEVLFAQRAQAAPPRSARRSCRGPGAAPRRSAGRSCARGLLERLQQRRRAGRGAGGREFHVLDHHDLVAGAERAASRHALGLADLLHAPGDARALGEVDVGVLLAQDQPADVALAAAVLAGTAAPRRSRPARRARSTRPGR